MLNIKNYIKDGFVKVCEVAEDNQHQWYYKNVNKDIMFDPHRSWVYFIVVDDEIVKVGETGNPLGIKGGYINQGWESQPKKGTSSRLGRYRNGDGTDAYIRQTLYKEVQDGRVSIWALRCEMIVANVTIAGQPHSTMTSFHKDLEIKYIKHFVQYMGQLPKLNKSHK